MVRNSDGKGTLVGPRCRWEDIIKIDLNGIVWDGVDWIYVAVDRAERWDVVNAAINRRVP
jgi:hypothetical protein